MRASEEALVGERADRAAFERCARAAASGARPLAHNHYKVELLPRTIVRALELAGETT
jgi:xanthine dehydrogenase YagS FAD-binding subunit